MASRDEFSHFMQRLHLKSIAPNIGLRPLDRKPTFCNARAMSAKGQKQTYAVQNVMSALPPKADMCGATAQVC